jgi:hypothetical protein
MATVSITLQGALTHSFKIPGVGDVKLVKGQPLVTSNPEIIRYVRSHSANDFAVTVLSDPEKEKRKLEPPPEGEAPVEAAPLPRVSRSPVRRGRAGSQE